MRNINRSTRGDSLFQGTTAQNTAIAKKIAENSDLSISTDPEVVDVSLGLSRAEVKNQDGKLWVRVVFPTILDLKKGDKVGLKTIQTLQPHDTVSWFYFVYKK